MSFIFRNILAIGLIIFMFGFIACSNDSKTPPEIQLPQVNDDSDDVATDDTSADDSSDDDSTPTPDPTPDPVDLDNDGDGLTENEGDCDDADPSVYLGAEEQCDDKDNDCDGNIEPNITVGKQDTGTFDYNTIQSAIDSFAGVDCVVVYPGVYEEDVDFKGMAITLQSAEGPNKTIINGTGLRNDYGGAVIFKTNETNTSILDGFTISTSHDRESADERGIYIIDSSPTIRNNIITKNITTYDDGCAIYVEADTKDASPIITDNEISNNECQYDHSYGVVFVLIADGSTSTQIRNNHIYDNSASLGGGGINVNFMRGTSSPIIENNIIERNNPCGVDVYFQNNNLNTITIRNNRIQDNEFHEVLISYGSNVQNSNNMIENNMILNNKDSGISLETPYDKAIIQGKIRNNILINNYIGLNFDFYNATSQIGTLVTPFEITNNTIANNDIGIGFGLSNNSTNSTVNVLVNNNIFSSNNRPIANTISSITSIITTYNDFYNNVQSCLNVSCTAQNNNLFIDPLFEKNYDLETREFDFHLQADSQCRNAGDPSSIYNNPDDKQNDMGAYGGPLADDWE